METAYILFMFLGPGLAINAYKKHLSTISKRNKAEGTIYEQSFGIVAHSAIVTAVTVAITWAVHRAIGADFPTNISGVINGLNDLKQLLLYIIICVIVTVVWYLIYEKTISRKLFDRYKDKLKEENGIIIGDIDNPTVWENIFLSKEENARRKVVSIFKDGNYVTSGELAGWNTGESEKRELRLYNSHIIEAVLESDKQKDDISERLLYNIEYDYYDTGSGTLIRFYDTEKLDKHWDEL